MSSLGRAHTKTLLHVELSVSAALLHAQLLHLWQQGSKFVVSVAQAL